MPDPAAAKIDLKRVPNFEAVDTWLEKLKAWCEEASRTVEELEERNTDLYDQYEKAQSELNVAEWKAGQFDELAEVIFDIDRGIKDSGDALAWLKSKGFEA